MYKIVYRQTLILSKEKALPQHFILIFFIFFALAAFVWAGYKLFQMKYLFLQRIISLKIINFSFFSTIAVREIASFILKQPGAKRRNLLKRITENDFSGLSKEISDKVLRAKLKLMLYSKITNSGPSDSLYCLMKTMAEIDNKNYDKARLLLSQIPKSKKTSGLQGLRLLCVARLALFETDLETASLEAGKALKIFQKNDLLFEEGLSYFVLGSIYRISGAFDTADFMLRAALKIFKFLKAYKYEAETLGTLGQLMAAQSRFEEACAFMDAAGDIFESMSDKENNCFIIDQKAMVELLRYNFKSAFDLACQASKKHVSAAGKGLSLEIMARSSFGENNWAKAVKLAQSAVQKYQTEKNYASLFECLYLMAEAEIRLGNPNKAEILLRKLIARARRQKTCFHIANAYTLLGTILLQRKELSQAKAVFNQALKYEFADNRISGIAIDYANLAMVEKQSGNRQDFTKNLETALNYAKEADEDLYCRLKAFLD